jgi:hypothetical protein
MTYPEGAPLTCLRPRLVGLCALAVSLAAPDNAFGVRNETSRASLSRLWRCGVEWWRFSVRSRSRSASRRPTPGPLNRRSRPQSRGCSELEHCGSIQDAAELLCRSGTVEDVAKKPRESGVRPAEPMTAYTAHNNDTPAEMLVANSGVIGRPLRRVFGPRRRRARCQTQPDLLSCVSWC